MEGYRVKVKGEYFAYTEKGKILKPYEFEVILPTLDRALHIIKSKILNRVLKKKFADYASYRTHEIIDSEPVGDAAPIQTSNKNLNVLNKKQLASYINKNELPVDPTTYKTVGEIRKAIQDAESNLKTFQEKEAKRAEDIALTKSLDALNPTLADEL